MPIKPENQKLYPKDWKAISRRIRFERAGGKCEQCEAKHDSYGYRDTEGRYHMIAEDETFLGMEAEAIALEGLDGETKVVRIVLTVAHLNHDPTDNREENLKALCQRCHLRYDAKLHQAEAAKTREKKRNERAAKVGQALMRFERH